MIVIPISLFFYYQMDKMQKEVIEYNRLSQECIKNWGSYYTKYGDEWAGCYKTIQERIDKKIY